MCTECVITSYSIHYTKLYDELAATTWDTGNEYFPPTTWQISNMHSGTGATNVVPGHADIVFNFRHGTASPVESLKERVHEILARHRNNFV